MTNRYYSPFKALAQAKPSQSQAKAGAYGLAWAIRKPKPPQAKPKPVAFRPSQARTTLFMALRAIQHPALHYAHLQLQGLDHGEVFVTIFNGVPAASFHAMGIVPGPWYAAGPNI